MKFIYLIFLLLLISCGTSNKNYVCGDRQCIDKKDFEKYFSDNLTAELIIKKRKKNKNVNLIELNKDSAGSNKMTKRAYRKQEKQKKKIEKDRLKTEKIKLIRERKINKIEEKKRNKEIKQVVKIPESQRVNQELINKKNDETQLDLPKDTNKDGRSGCLDINDCDIDKIAETLIRDGKEKPYPNITSN